MLGVLGEGSGKGEFLNGFMRGIFEFVFGEILSGEIAEGTVGVFGCILVFPWLVGLVVLLAEDSLELVLTCIEQNLH
jgi:hypothetical protein